MHFLNSLLIANYLLVFSAVNYTKMNIFIFFILVRVPSKFLTEYSEINDKGEN